MEEIVKILLLITRRTKKEMTKKNDPIMPLATIPSMNRHPISTAIEFIANLTTYPNKIPTLMDISVRETRAPRICAQR